MAQNHIDLLPATATVHSLSPRVRRRSAARTDEAHVVVATQNLPHVSGAIQALIQAGYLVTAYASRNRLLPRLHRLSSHPVSLLVIDGGLTPAFARAAAIAACSTYPDLPIILLATANATSRTEFMPTGVSVLRLPLSEVSLLAAAAALVARHRTGAGSFDEPPDAARAATDRSFCLSDGLAERTTGEE
jgi:hypothetical protein